LQGEEKNYCKIPLEWIGHRKLHLEKIRVLMEHTGESKITVFSKDRKTSKNTKL